MHRTTLRPDNLVPLGATPTPQMNCQVGGASPDAQFIPDGHLRESFLEQQVCAAIKPQVFNIYNL